MCTYVKKIRNFDQIYPRGLNRAKIVKYLFTHHTLYDIIVVDCIVNFLINKYFYQTYT